MTNGAQRRETNFAHGGRQSAAMRPSVRRRRGTKKTWLRPWPPFLLVGLDCAAQVLFGRRPGSLSVGCKPALILAWAVRIGTEDRAATRGLDLGRGHAGAAGVDLAVSALENPPVRARVAEVARPLNQRVV